MMLRQLRALTQTPGRLWRTLLVCAAVLLAIPAGWRAYDELVELNYQSRYRLIVQHRLWELHPEYKGASVVWTRTAARLLTDRQLMMRVRNKYGELAQQIELDYRRDLTMAQVGIAGTWLAIWGVPLVLVYVIGVLVERRPKRPPPRVQPASVTDSRYLP